MLVIAGELFQAGKWFQDTRKTVLLILDNKTVFIIKSKGRLQKYKCYIKLLKHWRGCCEQHSWVDTLICAKVVNENVTCADILLCRCFSHTLVSVQKQLSEKQVCHMRRVKLLWSQQRPVISRNGACNRKAFKFIRLCNYAKLVTCLSINRHQHIWFWKLLFKVTFKPVYFVALTGTFRLPEHKQWGRSCHRSWDSVAEGTCHL